MTAAMTILVLALCGCATGVAAPIDQAGQHPVRRGDVSA